MMRLQTLFSKSWDCVAATTSLAESCTVLTFFSTVILKFDFEKCGRKVSVRKVYSIVLWQKVVPKAHVRMFAMLTVTNLINAGF